MLSSAVAMELPSYNAHAQTRRPAEVVQSRDPVTTDEGLLFVKAWQQRTTRKLHRPCFSY